MINKKLVAVTCALLGTLATKAQTQKGNQLLGGFLGLTTSKGTNSNSMIGPNSIYDYTTDYRSNQFSIGPNYSYFIADNLDLGASVGYNHVKTKYTNTGYNFVNTPIENTAHAISGSIYLRKYLMFEQKIGFRAGPFVQYQYSKSSDSYNNQVNDTGAQTNKSVDAGIGLDFVYFPTKRFGLATTLGSLAYSHTDQKQSLQHQKSDSFGLNLATSGLTVSLFYSFGK
ncbi:PorT family protein [Mucilaginibacter robiniae]|uniref:PorT family protein n=1 Tax=Mucilaginibacter robiniae TaxID=2728022 RepID=A0A7L5DUY5_9SPHI|nr:outer membrane beta-barrel protein [Mucilaginibacter robiniae]QJD94521.1 PorT family protein [Mucilaginibacter robiniae]